MKLRMWNWQAFAASTLVVATVLAINVATGTTAFGEVLPEKQQQVTKIEESLQKAATLYRSKKYTDLAKLVEEMEQSVDALKTEANPELSPTLAAIEVRLSAAQRLVKSAFDNAAAIADAKKPAAPKMPAKAMAKKGAAGGGVSFVRDIAPMLASRCGNCHVNQARGEFSCASYASLRAGAAGLTVFQPGGEGGRLIEVLESGDMPRGSGPMSSDEIGLIGKWIKEGAKFDGPDPTANIMTFGGGAAPNAMAAANTMMTDAPSGSGTVQFMRDIAPILVNRCTSCHSGDQGAGQFELDTFTKLSGRGGRNGGALTPGNAGNSMLVKMLKGEAKDMLGKERRRMPARGEPLTSDQMKKIETWINEGARFDGDDRGVTIEFLLKQIQALKMSHEELAVSRVPLAEANWAKGNAGVQAEKVETDEFVIYGALPPARMQEIAKQITDERTKINNVLRLSSKDHIVKGKLSIFMVQKRFDLTEFARMVDERDVPSDVYGMFSTNTIDAHAILMMPKDGDNNFPLLVAEQLCGAHVDSFNKNLPKWFGAGAGRAYAVKVEPRAALVKHWEDELRAAVGSGKPTFVNDKTLDGPSTALAYGLARSLVANTAKFKAFTDDLKKGTKFDPAFQQHYGATPVVAATAWMRAGGR